MIPDGPAPARMRNLPSWLLTQSATHAHRLVHDGLAEIDARGYHYRLLATLAEYGPASQAELGRHSGIHTSDLVSTINELADGGFVRREPDPEDRRRNVVSLTTDGRKRLRRLDRTLGRVQQTLLAPLAPDEREQLRRLLTQLLDHHTRQRSPDSPDREP